MNEVEYTRQQLAAERSHLREILAASRRETRLRAVDPVSRYLDWATARLAAQLADLRTALAQAAPPPVPAQPQAERLTGLLEAWSEPLEALAARTLSTAQWRAVAHLSADSILEERRLYAAARAAAGLP